MRGCLYVLKPSLKDLEELTAKIASLVPGTAGYIGPDERLTSEHFLAGAGWKHSQWRHVHHRFGCRAWNVSPRRGLSTICGGPMLCAKYCIARAIH